MLGEYQVLRYPPNKDIHISFIYWITILVFKLFLNLFRCPGQILGFHIFQSNLILSNFKFLAISQLNFWHDLWNGIIDEDKS
jgi:hypothetical protein